MVNRAQKRVHRAGKIRPLPKDGQVVARFFNPVAGRPFPVRTALTDTITVSLALAIAGFATSSSVPTYGSYSFTLSQCASASQYSGLFDQYRIELVEVWIECASNATGTATTALATAIDLDDANTPASIGELEDRQGALYGGDANGRYHAWRPHIAIAEFSGTFTSYGNVAAGWIDVASPAVQHYGLKYAAGVDGVSRAFLVNARAVVSFRGPAI